MSRRIPIAALLAGLLSAAPAAAQSAPFVIGIPGERADDNFGFAIARAGDLNGDGFEDLVVTAIFNDDTADAAGKAYVFFGGPAFDRVADVVMFGEAPDEHFGVSADGAGDVNGDGFDDLIVGARFNDRGGSAAGAAFIFFGGRPMDAEPDAILVGEAGDDWFGQSVSGAGDLDGDGFADVAVGAPFNDRAANAAGAAYVFLGGRAMDSLPDLIVTGQGNDEQVGWAVGGGGDVNGDGFDDIVVGARLFPVSTAAGRALVYFGGRTLDDAPDVILNGEFGGDWFGSAVGMLPDMDGDGFDEVGVGAIFADPIVNGQPVSAAGKAYVYRGGSPMGTAAALVLSGSHRDEQFGNAIQSAGDVNGDGLWDLIVGGHFFNPGSARAAGRAVLFLGARTLDGAADFTLVGEAADDQLGHAVGGADLNGDGRSEPVASAVFNDQAGSGAGKAYVAFQDPIRVEAAPDRVEWASSFPFGSFNVYRGGLAELQTGSYGSCLAHGVTDLGFPDPELPDPGRGFFYLVTGVDQGTESPLGFTSAGALRPNTDPCP